MRYSHFRMSLIQFLILALCTLGSVAQTTITATCAVAVNPVLAAGIKDAVTGTVTFEQPAGGNTTVKIKLSGFDTSDSNTYHGFHIHVSDNMTVGCNSLGGHYNPMNVNHGGPTAAVRHYGDLGNVQEDQTGAVSRTIEDHLVALSGTYSVIGRSIVVHQAKDDLGLGGNAESRKTGNAGSRIACCIISPSSSSSKFSWSFTSFLTALAASWLKKLFFL